MERGLQATLHGQLCSALLDSPPNIKVAVLKNKGKKRKNKPEMKASSGRKYPATFLAQIEQIISGLYSALMPSNSDQFGQAISHMLSRASPPTAFSQIVLAGTGSILLMTSFPFSKPL